MAEAAALETLSPKELGKHLREVRRRKGLSRSEVARGAGLTRRELSAYEKGKSAIPDSDLFVLAGSCGVDVAELRALVTSNGAPVPSSIEDAVAEPPPGLEVAAPSLSKRSRRKRARALGSTDVAAPEPDPADARAPAELIDIFEELAQLPEPEPLSTDDPADHDIFSPPPGDAHALREWPAFQSDHGQSDHGQSDDGDAAALDENGLDESAADALPINGEVRGEAYISPWEPLRSDDAPSEPAFTAADHWRFSSSTDDATGTVADTNGWKPVSVVANTYRPWSDTMSTGSGDDEPPAVSWRPQLDASPAPGVEAVALSLVEPPSLPDVEPEQFVAAGSEWVLGNTVPLVEVLDTGGLVMHRADERWALADVVAPSNFALEVDVDLRSGPGFGVLFCADVDDRGRMSGYSFDVDPADEGRRYRVRQWCADREQWNRIADVSGGNAAHVNGLLEVRVTLDDGRLVASVNGETVLTVENLPQASLDRGRAGACGHRVGVQASSSTDLVIDELRLAHH